MGIHQYSTCTVEQRLRFLKQHLLHEQLVLLYEKALGLSMSDDENVDHVDSGTLPNSTSNSFLRTDEQENDSANIMREEEEEEEEEKRRRWKKKRKRKKKRRRRQATWSESS